MNSIIKKLGINKNPAVSKDISANYHSNYV
jgi:hypothetical protein